MLESFCFLDINIILFFRTRLCQAVRKVVISAKKGGVCKTRNTPGTPRNNPEHPGNTPEHPRNTPGTARNNPGTLLEHPMIPRNTRETARNNPGTPKIVVSGQTAHELTKPKTSEDSQFFIRLLRITLRFQSISRMLGIFSKLLRTAKKPLINGENISCT